jgi:UDP-N-acetylglucosamine transferase subunit ALG13
MIFITVGNMDPFDRLIRTVDEWVKSRQCSEEIIAQIGRGSYHPKNFQ